MEKKRQNTTVDVIILSINNCYIDGTQCATDTVCHKPREFFQCKCRSSTYVKIWEGFLIFYNKNIEFKIAGIHCFVKCVG